MCDLAKILLGLGSTIGALGTFGVAIFAYRLASKNFTIIADKHDREAVSIVFDKFVCENYLIYPTFIIYNNANVPLQIESIKLLSHTNNMGWKADLKGFLRGKYSQELAKWNQRGLSSRRGNPNEFYSIILKPHESAQIFCEYLTSKTMEQNFNIGYLQAQLRYNGAISRKYGLTIPDTQEVREIIKGMQVTHDSATKKG